MPMTTINPMGPLTDRARAGEAARFLKVLANDSRLMVLCSLNEGELSVGELQQRVPLSQSALSQHLAVLRREGLVATRREAQTIHYRIADPRVHELMPTVCNLFGSPQ
jgi:ArsR family transcriptional regulator, virulence genes transcriptional regulator